MSLPPLPRTEYFGSGMLGAALDPCTERNVWEDASSFSDRHMLSQGPTLARLCRLAQCAGGSPAGSR